MDQQVVNAVFTLAGALMSWILKTVWDAIKDLNKDIKEIESEMHIKFVMKDDFNNAITRIEGMCNKILDKLDHKADK